MRRAPIWLGRMRLPKPDCGAVVRTKKSISGAVDGDQGEVVFGEDGAVEGEAISGQTRWRRISSERRVPMMTEMRARTRY
jgi:hypothetical protein